jgi:hypothetical protein
VSCLSHIFDVPQAAYVSKVMLTEGSGLGRSTEPPVAIVKTSAMLSSTSDQKQQSLKEARSRKDSRLSGRSSGVSSNGTDDSEDENSSEFSDQAEGEFSNDEGDIVAVNDRVLQLRDVLMVPSQSASYLTHNVDVTAKVQITWNLALIQPSTGEEQGFVNEMRTLFMILPAEIKPGFKEGLVTLLEYAEDSLHCGRVVIAIDKVRSGAEMQSLLCRVFQFVGFSMLPEGSLSSWVRPCANARCKFYGLDLDQI